MHPLTTKSQSILLIQLVLKKKAKTIVLLKCKNKKKATNFPKCYSPWISNIKTKQNKTKALKIDIYCERHGINDYK